MSCRTSLWWSCTLLYRISSQKKLLNFPNLRFLIHLNYEKSRNSNKIEYQTKKSADLLLRSVQERRSILHRYSPRRTPEHVIGYSWCPEKLIFSKRSQNVPGTFWERFGNVLKYACRIFDSHSQHLPRRRSMDHNNVHGIPA